MRIGADPDSSAPRGSRRRAFPPRPRPAGGPSISRSSWPERCGGSAHPSSPRAPTVGTDRPSSPAPPSTVPPGTTLSRADSIPPARSRPSTPPASSRGWTRPFRARPRWPTRANCISCRSADACASVRAELVHVLLQRGLAALIERKEPDRAHLAAADLEHRHRDGKAETPRTCARGVQVADAVDELVVGEMAMPEDDHVCGLPQKLPHDLGPGPLGSIEDVGQEEADTPELDARRLACLSAAESIDVPGHRRHRREVLQVSQDLDVPDVAGVEDVVRACEGGEDLQPEEAVGVGEDADAHPIFLLAVARACNKP